MGLDQAGKTCIAKCLQGIKHLTAFTITKPTMGFNRITFHALGSEFIILDFSGQELYRDHHLKNFDRYVKDANKFIYVIDIQDIDRYQLALDYLKNIINRLPMKEKAAIDFSIFLHKYDIEWDNSSNKTGEATIKELIKHVKEIVPSNISYTIHKTSIYTVFEKSFIS